MVYFFIFASPSKKPIDAHIKSLNSESVAIQLDILNPYNIKIDSIDIIHIEKAINI